MSKSTYIHEMHLCAKSIKLFVKSCRIFFFWKSCFEPLSNKFTSDFCKESYKHINMSVKYGKIYCTMQYFICMNVRKNKRFNLGDTYIKRCKKKNSKKVVGKLLDWLKKNFILLLFCFWEFASTKSGHINACVLYHNFT